MFRKKISLMISKYEDFFSYISIITPVILLVIIYQNFQSFSIEKSLITFGYTFSGFIGFCLLLILPFDIIKSRKDMKMCKDIAVEYESVFLTLDSVDKQIIRDKYKTWNKSSPKPEIDDWLDFEL